MAYFYGWSMDDPFITYRYAENLADGHGPVFNIGDPVEGHSTPLLVLILAVAHGLGLALPTFAPALGIACALGALGAMFWRLRREDDAGAPAPIRLAGLYVLALNGPFALYAVSGMETPLYALLCLLALIACANEMETGGGRLPASALLGALAALTRPEGALVFTVCLIARAIWRFQGQGRDRWGRIALSAGVFAALGGTFLVWRVAYYGDWLPNTYYAKMTGEPLSARLVRGLGYAWSALAMSGGALAVGALAWGAARAWSGSPLRLAVCGFCAAHLLFILVSGGDWMVGGRFIAPLAPALAWLIQDALRAFWRAAQCWRRPARWRWGAVALAALCLAGALWAERRETRPVMTLLRAGALHQPYIAAGRWLAEYGRPDQTVASMEAGIVPYYSGLRLLDMGGLMDRHIARLEGEHMYKTDTDYILEQAPDFVFMQLRATDPPQAYYPDGPDKALLAHPAFLARYRIAQTWPRGANPMALFERQR